MEEEMNKINCPNCDGTGITWMGLECEVECSLCEGKGYITE